MLDSVSWDNYAKQINKAKCTKVFIKEIKESRCLIQKQKLSMLK